MKQLLIINSLVSLSKIRSIITEFKIQEWLPLVSNYERVKEIEEELNGGFRKRNISTELQKVAANLRRPFFELTARLGQKYESLAWWANSTSERNTMINKLFLHCCYVLLANNYISEGQKLCIVCDNNAVIDTIEMLAIEKGYQVKKNKASFSLTLKDTVFYIICSGLYNLLKELYVWFLYKSSKIYCRSRKNSVHKDMTKTDIIIHTWVDEKCFGENYKFNDRYFTVLPEFYKNKGLRVSTFVSLYNIKRSYRSAISFFRNCQDNFIVPEEYYKLRDYLLPFKIWFKKFKFDFSSVCLEGVDVSLLFRANNKSERIKFISMYYLLIKRLAERNILPKVIIDCLENMIPEKMILLGARKFMPKSLTYGFYHIIPSPNILCFFTDKIEREIAPLPDKIICNGKKFKNILIQEHFSEEKIVVGAALRHFYLYDIEKTHITDRKKDFNILLILPLQKEVSVEIFDKLARSVEGISHYSILIKPHPMGTAIINKMKKKFTSNMNIADESMAKALSQCDVVVSSATGAVMDCLMANKEVIRVGRETQLNLDPLEWFKEFGQLVSTVEDLRKRLLCLESKIKNEHYEAPNYSSLLPDLFSPATEENMKAYLAVKRHTDQAFSF